MALTISKHIENEKKWNTFWEDLLNHIRRHIQIESILFDTYSVILVYGGKVYQLRGEKNNFKFQNNNAVTIRATSQVSGKFITIYTFNIKNKNTSKNYGYYKIEKDYTCSDMQFIETLKLKVKDFFKQQSIKFILEDD